MKGVLGPIAVQALALQAHALRIIQSNDDGWAELNLRTLNDALRDSGHDVVVSAPADNQSGTSTSDAEPEGREEPCHYDSCTPNGASTGRNETRPDLNWVNSYPVTSTRFGIDQFGPEQWDGATPDLVTAGPNYVPNLWLAVHFSGTVGAAVYAAHDAGVPAIAFSAASPGGSQPWNAEPVPEHSLVYAELSTRLVDKLAESGTPYLPDDVFLNVNFPAAEGDCASADDFHWVLSRINIGLLSDRDVDWCGSDRLPHEQKVFDTDGCYVAVSVGDASDKTTVDAERQQVVLDKISGMLTCLP